MPPAMSVSGISIYFLKGGGSLIFFIREAINKFFTGESVQDRTRRETLGEF